MARDYMTILKAKPRGPIPKGIAANPKAVAAIRAALAYAASPEGKGLDGMRVWEALSEAGVLTQEYRGFTDYCRKYERVLWDKMLAQRR